MRSLWEKQYEASAGSIPLCLGAAFKLRHLAVVLNWAPLQLCLCLASPQWSELCSWTKQFDFVTRSQTCSIPVDSLGCWLTLCTVTGPKPDPDLTFWPWSWTYLITRLANWLPSLDPLHFPCLDTVGPHSLLVGPLPLPALLSPVAPGLSSLTE